MDMLIKLAWRNLWRQKRRTLLTASALALALFLSLMTRCLQEGSYSSNIENAARFYTGLIQLQNPNFRESQSIDELLPQSDEFIEPVRSHPNIQYTLPRIESFALASVQDRSKGVIILGIEPQLEEAYSNISHKVVAGSYLVEGDQGVLIGAGLARYLKLDIGDEIVLYGQGYRGQVAAGLYTVNGILDYPLAALDNQLVYMPLKLAQTLFSTGEQVTAWVLHTYELDRITQTEQQIKDRYLSLVEVRNWTDLYPEMAQQIQLDRIGGIFLIYILYGIVGFGLFATVLMMMLERQREFGVMVATGMLRSKLMKLLVIESGFISIIGIILGLVVAGPFLIYFYFNPIEITGDAGQLMIESGFEPIIPVLIDARIVVNQIMTVLFLSALCLIYPLYRTYFLDVVSALKGGERAH